MAMTREERRNAVVRACQKVAEEFKNPAVRSVVESFDRQAIADRWTGERCTLNGLPAKITGRLLKFGFVSPFDDNYAAEFPWETIDRVMAKGGKFTA
jgi:hypothetical protein